MSQPEKIGIDDLLASGGKITDIRIVDALPPLNPQAAPPERSVIVQRLDEIEAKPIEWLWRGWLAQFMLTILGGFGGDGKSTLLSYLIAIFSRGGILPDGTQAPVINSLILAAEDDPQYAIRPLLDLHLADLTRVFILKGTQREDGTRAWFDLRRDVDEMRRVIEEYNIGLVVIDPLSSYMPKSDRNNEGDVRDALMPLQMLMEETGVAVVGVMHVGMAEGARKPSQRLMGSTAFTALARMVWMLHDLPDEHQPEPGADGLRVKRKVWGVVESNYSIPPQGVMFSRPLDGPLRFHGVSPVSIEEAFVAEAKFTTPSKKDDAKDWLAGCLKNGPMLHEDVLKQWTAAGFSDATIRRASEELNAQKREGKNGQWKVLLVASSPETGFVAYSNDRRTDIKTHKFPNESG